MEYPSILLLFVVVRPYLLVSAAPIAARFSESFFLSFDSGAPDVPDILHGLAKVSDASTVL